MKYIKEILPGDKLEQFNKESDRLSEKLMSLTGTWVDRPIIREIIIWYYTKKYLKAVKRLTNGI
jgi:hypothetical protein